MSSFDGNIPFLNLDLSITNGIVATKIDDKYGNFEIVNFQLLDRDVLRHSSYGEYTLQLLRFARVYAYISYFNN